MTRTEVDTPADSFEGTDSATLASIPRPKRKVLLWLFVVNDDIGYLTLFTLLLGSFASICFVAYLSIIQPFVLTILLRITTNTGNITGSLALYDEIIALPATLLGGVISDRVGRRPVYAAGFTCIGLALILYPLVKNVYPHMLLCRLLFSIGSALCTCMMTGMLGDVAGGHQERGRVSALVGMFAGFGGLVAGLVLIKLPYQMSTLVKTEAEGLRLAFQIVGGCSILLAALFFLTMPKAQAKARNTVSWFMACFSPRDPILEGPEPIHQVDSFFVMLKYGFVAAKDPRIALAYVSSFVARADTVLFSSYMSLWVIHHYLEMNWCTAMNDCRAAAGDTHMMTGYAQGISLAFAPLYGYASEKLHRSTILAFAGIVGAVGSIPFAFSDAEPSAQINRIFVTLVGIGQIGMIVTGMTLVNGPYIKKKYRGSVAGVFSFCGALSIMIMARLGGFLFDDWMRGAPFVLMGIAHIVIALLAIYTRIVTPRLEREDRIKYAEEERLEKARIEQEKEEQRLAEGEKSHQAADVDTVQ